MVRYRNKDKKSYKSTVKERREKEGREGRKERGEGEKERRKGRILTATFSE